MTIKLNITFNATDDVWYAYDGATENDSRHIGQGITPEAASADYWYQRKGDAAELSHDEEGGWWVLEQGCHKRLFVSREAALKYCAEHDWQIV